MINVYADSKSELLLASFNIDYMFGLDRPFTAISQYMVLDLLRFDPHNSKLAFFYDQFREIMINNGLPHKKYPKQTFEIKILFESVVDITDDVIVGIYDQNELYRLTQNELLSSFKVKNIMKKHGRIRV
jgi:hypothetical protein